MYLDVLFMTCVVLTYLEPFLQRQLTVATAGQRALQHLGIVGDTCATLIAGDETGGQFCLIDMHIP